MSAEIVELFLTRTRQSNFTARDLEGNNIFGKTK